MDFLEYRHIANVSHAAIILFLFKTRPCTSVKRRHYGSNSIHLQQIYCVTTTNYDHTTEHHIQKKVN